MVKGKREKKGNFPSIITCPNEMVALSMADGYARYTSRPQCVIVHVDVGTQGLAAAVHNASCGRAPVLIFAGLSPFTIEGELRGSRTEYIHWIQDVPDQKQIVSQYCRYTAELKTGRNVKQMVGRALQFARSAPAGPVYLFGAREVMEEEIEPYDLNQAYWDLVSGAALPENGVQKISQALVGAQEPLVITGYSGRNHEAVKELVKLTETVKGLRVLNTGGSDLCFPADHRADLGLRYGVDDSIRTADVILVADCDVPWIPTLCKPQPSARIFHIDIDPLKQQMPVFYIPAEARYRADTCIAFNQLHTHISHDPTLSQQASSPSHQDRWEALASQHSARIQSIRDLPALQPTDYFNTSHLISRLRALVPQDTIFAVEAVTNTAFVSDHLHCTTPGTFINCGGGGLGWSGGGALGIKLAAGANRFRAGQRLLDRAEIRITGPDHRAKQSRVESAEEVVAAGASRGGRIEGEWRGTGHRVQAKPGLCGDREGGSRRESVGGESEESGGVGGEVGRGG
ncbi:MAG: hypothetical protein Q9190_003615 [Brigantiaea leucoxantha]